MTQMAVPGTLKVKVGGVSVPVPFYSMPPGVMAMWPTATAPPGWLFCRGQVVDRAAYASLFAVIGTDYNTGGETASQFRLPDLQVRTPIGAGTGKALGATEGLAEASRNVRHSHSHGHAGSTASSSTTVSVAGAYTGTGVTATNTDHNHTGPADHPSQNNSPTSGGAIRLTATGHGSTGLAAQAGGQVHSHGISDPSHGHAGSTASTTTTVTVATGDSGAHPFLVINYIIKE